MFTKTKNSELVTRQSKILLTRTEYKRRNALIFLSLHFALSQSLFCLFVSSSCLKFKSKIIVFWCILFPVKWIESTIFFSIHLLFRYLVTYKFSRYILVSSYIRLLKYKNKTENLQLLFQWKKNLCRIGI